MTEKCEECGKDLAVDSESSYCLKCDALLDKKFDLTESERYNLYESYRQEVREKYSFLHAG